MNNDACDDYGQFIDLEPEELYIRYKNYTIRSEIDNNNMNKAGEYGVYFIRIISWATITFILYRTICH
jgi:hypothetical protein